MIPLYIPTRKITIMTPKVLKKLIFILNYKGLITTTIQCVDNTSSIQFGDYDMFRRLIVRWQRGANPADAILWDWINENVTIQLKLIHVDQTETLQRKENPFVAVITFESNKSDTFADLFKNSMMGP